MTQQNKIRTGQIDGALKSKLIQITRDMTSASGDVSYTGVGFIPTSLLIKGCKTGVASFFEGMADSTKLIEGITLDGGVYYGNQQSIQIIDPGVGRQAAVVKTFDSDGFTLTWTKTNSPTGSAEISILCLR